MHFISTSGMYLQSSVIGTEIHTFDITLSVAFSAYKSMLAFGELDYRIPTSYEMNLTLVPINHSPTVLRIALVSYAANRFYKLSVRYLVLDDAVT